MFINPAFDPSTAELAAARRMLKEGGGPLVRPVVMLSGYHSPEFPLAMLARRLEKYGAGGKDNAVMVSYRSAGRMEEVVARVEKLVGERGWGGQEVDVVAHSMGGLVARQMVAEGRLAVKRLFTVSTPHRGALLALRGGMDALGRDLRAGSERLAWLDERLPAFMAGGGELVCYVLLRDWMVGARNAAPPGQEPLWLDGAGLMARWLSHFVVVRDDRIAIDVALRLRGFRALSRAGEPPPRD